MDNLTRKNLLTNPIEQFALWFKEAKNSVPTDNPDSACLSTINAEGFPDGRVILIKEFDDKGFVFYTNIESPKGTSLLENQKASLTFHWDSLHKQIRVLGTAQLVSDKQADAYFKSRPRESQLGAWASQQSSVLEARSILNQRFEELTEKFKGQEITRPPFWSGFRIKPARIEFWQQRDNRLHDRFVFIKNQLQGWDIQRLYP